MDVHDMLKRLQDNRIAEIDVEEDGEFFNVRFKQTVLEYQIPKGELV